MKTRAVRLHGVMDLRLEEIELPEIKDGEILACIISDSICMSSYKAASQGAAHKRVPDDVAENLTEIASVDTADCRNVLNGNIILKILFNIIHRFFDIIITHSAARYKSCRFGRL